MSNYVKAVDYSAKDALASGNPNKIIKGAELNDEFNAIATAVGTKADLSSPIFLGNPSATTQLLGNNSTRIATTAFVQAALQALYLPIGSIHISVISTNPATTLGYGTWVSFGAGRVLVGIDAGDTYFDTVEETGGSKDSVVVSHTHTATVTDPGHTHNIMTNAGSGATYPYGLTAGGAAPSLLTQTATTGVSVLNSTEGVSGANANLQPYITVYMWKRTA